MAELIREYLEFYSLDYSKQIFMPETNLNTKPQSSHETLVAKTGLNDVSAKKPLLLQLLEQFQAGGGGVPKSIEKIRGGILQSESSPDAAPGV